MIAFSDEGCKGGENSIFAFGGFLHLISAGKTTSLIAGSTALVKNHQKAFQTEAGIKGSN